MKRIIQTITALILMMALLVGCGGAGSDHVMAAVKPDRDASDKENLTTWIDKGKEISTRDFDEKTIARFLAGGTNKVYSPVNVYIALSMLTEGCGGETRDELLSLLGSTDTKALRQKAQAMWNANYFDDEEATKIANSLWLNDQVNFREELLKTYAEEYYASTFFGKMGTSEMDKLLQDWVNENTGGELQEEVSNLKTKPETLVEILSTIYFKAKWAEKYKFNENLTSQQTFHGANGDQQVSTMHQGFDGSIYRTDQFTECELALTGGKMCFFLPEEGVELDEILKNGSLVEALHRNDEEAKPVGTSDYYDIINFSVPKFEIHSEQQLIEDLQELGVKKVFTPGVADMSNLISAGKNGGIATAPYVSSIKHDAMVRINEKGVVAAAYTAIEADGAMAAPVEEREIDFHLDRPFLYAITGNDGSILFVGTIYDVQN